MNFATASAAELAAAGYVTKQLKQRGPRKGETWQRQSQHGSGRALNHAGQAVSGSSTGASAVGSGGSMNLNAVGGIGKTMVRDIESVKRKAAAQYKADRRQAAIDRAMGL